MSTVLESAQMYLFHLSQRNHHELMQMFAEEVDWYIPGDQKKAPWLGRRSSKDEISEFFLQLWRATEAVSASIVHLAAEGDQAIIAGDFSTKMLATGKVVDSMFCIRMQFREGKIVWYRLLEDSWAVFKSMED